MFTIPQRFQIELEEVGSENETLYECFGCLNTERLVNRTCVPDLMVEEQINSGLQG